MSIPNFLLFLLFFYFSKLSFQSNLKVSQNLLHDLTSKVSITENIQLLWKFHQNSTISMAFRWNSKGYFALGFGVSMSGLDIIVAEKIDEEIILSDRWSQVRKTPKMDEEWGGKNDLIMLGYILKDEDGYAIVKFNRKLNTNDKYCILFFRRKKSLDMIT